MKIKDGFLIKSVAGKTIVVPVGGAMLDFNGVLTLNDTGAFLFEILQKSDVSKEELVKCITDNYEVSKEIATRDVDLFLEKISEVGMME